MRIAIADDEPRQRQFYRKVLGELGHIVVVEAANGRELVDACQETPVDLVITDIKMPDFDGLQAAGEIRDSIAKPVILVSAYHDEDLIRRSLENHVLAYLIKPIKKADLPPAIALVTRRFWEFQLLQQQADSLRQAMEDRKLIERAKGVIMKLSRVPEDEAFRRLQRLASKKNLKLVDLARSIIEAEEAYSVH
mgnify:FL=1